MFEPQRPLKIGNLELPHRLIQGPLAGYSCAPMRALFSHFQAPAYCVTEMISAHDLVHKRQHHQRYLYRSPLEHRLCYQLAGHDPQLMAKAAQKCQALGADLIDINCGCPKNKITRKGYGSALLQQPQRLQNIIQEIKAITSIPLTIKIRLSNSVTATQELIQRITEAGADAIIIHARQPQHSYTTPCDYTQVKHLKSLTHLPIIINGDIQDLSSLKFASIQTQADAAMLSRAGCGRPWLYQELLQKQAITLSNQKKLDLLIQHLHALAKLETEWQALLQARSLMGYYFREYRQHFNIQELVPCQTLIAFTDKLIQQLKSIAAP